MSRSLRPFFLCLRYLYTTIFGMVYLFTLYNALAKPVIPPEHQQYETSKMAAAGEPVMSHGESYANAAATGEGSTVNTNSWSTVNNHGGMHVNNVTSNGTIIGSQVEGMTNCSQESWAEAYGAWSANAIAYGLCNSSVLLVQPVSNTGVGKNGIVQGNAVN